MKHKHVIAHMRSLKNYADCSTAVRAKVGCLIVKDDRVISIGYNGTPPGWDNCCEYERAINIETSEKLTKIELVTKPEVMHAEFNALMKICKSHESSDGASLFCTYSPCFECAKMMVMAGIKEVYFSEHYKTDNGAGFKFLEKCGICPTEITNEHVWSEQHGEK